MSWKRRINVQESNRQKHRGIQKSSFADACRDTSQNMFTSCLPCFPSPWNRSPCKLCTLCRLAGTNPSIPNAKVCFPNWGDDLTACPCSWHLGCARVKKYLLESSLDLQNNMSNTFLFWQLCSKQNAHSSCNPWQACPWKLSDHGLGPQSKHVSKPAIFVDFLRRLSLWKRSIRHQAPKHRRIAGGRPHDRILGLYSNLCESMYISWTAANILKTWASKVSSVFSRFYA